MFSDIPQFISLNYVTAVYFQIPSVTDKQNATAFAEHLASVFQPFPSQLSVTEEETINNNLNVPHQIALPLKKIRINEVKNVIQYKIIPKKSPIYDLVTGKGLKEVSQKGLRAITQIYNAIPQTEYFPYQWKLEQIIMIVKPGKNPNDITSYRLISLLPILSKILEKIFLNRLTPIIDENKLIPYHQFGFRKEHRTIEQAHSLVYKINDLESKRYFSAAFINISQAFDKVWHTGLLYKLKRAFPHPDYTLLQSYLTYRTFQVRYQKEYTKLNTIQSGVPQGSILGPILYSIFTADLPLTEQTLAATYADDTAILASHQNPITASRKLQNHLSQFEKWLKRWRIKANENKSTHVAFTLKREKCPSHTEWKPNSARRNCQIRT